MLNLPIKILDRHVTPAGGEANLTFAGIDDLVAQWDALKGLTSRHLVLIVNASSEDVGDYWDLGVRPNGSAVADKEYQAGLGSGAGASTGRITGSSAWTCGRCIPAGNYPDAFGGVVLLIPHAFNTTNHKNALLLGGAAEHAVNMAVFRWPHTDAITSLYLYIGGTFTANSKFLLGVIDESYLVEEIEDAAADFSPTWNIPQGEGDLITIGYLRSDQAAVEDEVLHTINDDTTAANYPAQELTGRAAVFAAASPVNQEIGMVSGDNATALVFGPLVAVYSQYTKQNQQHYLSLSGYVESSGPTSEIRLMSGRRDNVEPINKLALSPNAGTDFKAGSLFSLYRVPKRLIDRQVLTVDTATITFNNIPQYYEALQLHVYARTDNGANPRDSVLVSFNNDLVVANYNEQELAGFVAAVLASRNISRAAMMVAGDIAAVGVFGGGSIMMPGYARTDGHKHRVNLSGAAENIVRVYSSHWEDSSPITRIDLAPGAGANFLAGSVFELEGVLRKEGLPADAGMSVGIP